MKGLVLGDPELVDEYYTLIFTSNMQGLVWSELELPHEYDIDHYGKVQTNQLGGMQPS